ncbi:hypothetical protein H9Q69_009046 [Fusarium xylarioides]|nr:hypothetical protein H9Q70_008828 [Fusarium xylarioides]KAG5781447.1 hypothetical protein H9Q73_004866 [Fusarium xylarioides]KAG5791905.1 hypothetical protein H9Q69_009046 [Fusarium xylarioides]
MDQFGDDVCAVLGRVEFSPRMELCLKHTRLKDWALVELAQDSFTTKLSELRNKIPVPKALQLMVNGVPGPAVDRIERLGFETSLEVTVGPSVIPERELRVAGPSPSPELFVMKHGRTSGFTVGRSNGILSVTRYANKFVGEVLSREWCIIAKDNDDAHINFFSVEGDSGAPVFDLKGRVGGMITGGLKAEKNPRGKHDITYAAPMEWILEDIARHGYDVKLPK